MKRLPDRPLRTQIEERAMPRTRLRRRINAIHATVLIALGAIFSVNCVLGGLAGVGGYPFLVNNHIGAVGLLQAYLLMALVGAAILVAHKTTQPLPRAWNWVAIVAHFPPLLAVALFAGGTPEMTPRVVALSLAIHFAGSGVELLALALDSNPRS